MKPHLLLVRPSAFGFNAETAGSNVFQKMPEGGEASLAVREFEEVVRQLTRADIPVTIFDDTPEPAKPDAVFPNNWLSAHPDGTLVLYPLLAPNRRAERRPDILHWLRSEFAVWRTIDLTHYEQQGRYLEGTGSLVFDHAHRMVLACRSSRTHEEVVADLCRQLQYEYLLFSAHDAHRVPFYHTNVMLWVGASVAAVCLESISDEGELDALLDFFENTKRKVFALSWAQVQAFAGNMLEVESRAGHPYFLLSDTARQALHPGQTRTLEQYGDLLPVSIPSIERVGGGSVRCMVADIYLPRPA